MRELHRLLSICVLVASSAALAVARGAEGELVELWVDAAAAPGGDGSEELPLPTIQEALAALPASGMALVRVRQGTYLGPVIVDRPQTRIEGQTTPTFDAEGYLDGFEDEVIITIDRLLIPAQGREAEDLVEVRASHVAVRRFVADAGGIVHDWENAAFSAKAESESDRMTGIAFEHLLVRGEFDTAVWTRNADARVDHLTTRDPGYLAVNPTGNGHVTVSWLDVENKEVGVCFLSQWLPEEYWGDAGTLTGGVFNSRFGPGQVYFDFFGGTLGVLLLGRGMLTNPARPMDLRVVAAGNVISGVDVGVRVGAWQFPRDWGSEGAPWTAGLFVQLDAYNNALATAVADTVVATQPTWDPTYIDNTTIVVFDGDGIFPETIDLGPPELQNRYLRMNAIGPAGPPGADGQDGQDGEPGQDGQEGPAGPAGPMGPEGPRGPSGPAGAQGDPGLAGADGEAACAGGGVLPPALVMLALLVVRKRSRPCR